MTRLSQLRAVARCVGDAFADHPAISAILVFGSVSLGRVDEHSDVDMLIVCTPDILPLSDRKRILGSVGARWRFDQRDENSLFAVVDEDGWVGDIAVTVHFQTTSWIDTVLDEVLTKGAISTEQMPFRPYTVPALLQRAWVLVDRDIHVERWRQMAASYPPLLQKNILCHFTPSLREHLDELKRTAERGLGARAFIFFLDRCADDLTSILFALNGVYDPADRRMDTEIVPFLPCLPEGYVPTMADVLEGPFDQRGMLYRAQLFEQLAEETLLMAETLLGETSKTPGSDGEQRGPRSR